MGDSLRDAVPTAGLRQRERVIQLKETKSSWEEVYALTAAIGVSLNLIGSMLSSKVEIGASLGYL